MRARVRVAVKARVRLRARDEARARLRAHATSRAPMLPPAELRYSSCTTGCSVGVLKAAAVPVEVAAFVGVAVVAALRRVSRRTWLTLRLGLGLGFALW